MRVDFSKELGWCQRMAKKRFPMIPASAWTADIKAWADDSFQVVLRHSVPVMKAHIILWQRTDKGEKKSIRMNVDRRIG
jgi:hypothetical protein